MVVRKGQTSMLRRLSNFNERISLQHLHSPEHRQKQTSEDHKDLVIVCTLICREPILLFCFLVLISVIRIVLIFQSFLNSMVSHIYPKSPMTLRLDINGRASLQHNWMMMSIHSVEITLLMHSKVPRGFWVAELHENKNPFRENLQCKTQGIIITHKEDGVVSIMDVEDNSKRPLLVEVPFFDSLCNTR